MVAKQLQGLKNLGVLNLFPHADQRCRPDPPAVLPQFQELVLNLTQFTAAGVVE